MTEERQDKLIRISEAAELPGVHPDIITCFPLLQSYFIGYTGLLPFYIFHDYPLPIARQPF